MATATLTRDQQINAIHIALVLAIDAAKSVRYDLVQDALHENINEPSPSVNRMRTAIKTLFPEAHCLDDVTTSDIEHLFAAVIHDFERANHIASIA
jgi:hypothetical protein